MSSLLPRTFSIAACVLTAISAVPLIGASPASAEVASLSEWRQEAPATSPGPRGDHMMAYHAATGEAVVFGGGNLSNKLADTWVLRSSAGTWAQRFPAVSPTARNYGAMTYHAATAESILFGGSDAVGTRLDETWAWDGIGWAEKTVATPPTPRDFHALAYDAVRGETVLFGGVADPGTPQNANDTWVWNGLTWVQRLPATVPSARHNHTMAYDSAHQQVVLFGGYGASGTLNDTWVWDGTTWTQKAPATSPPPLNDPSMAFDPVLGRVVLFGGQSSTGTYQDDTWIWNGNNWAQANTADHPSARTGSTMAFDLALGRILLFGGWDGGVYNDTWTFGPAVTPPPPTYPTDDPSCAAGANVLAGYVQDTFVQVRTGPDAGGGTAVCVAADDGNTHLGGKLVVDGAPDVLTTDANAGACALDANNERLQSGMLLGQPYALDVTPLPDGEPDAAWVCVQAAGSGVRLVLDHAPGTGTRFEPDSLLPHPPYPEEAWPAPGQPSADCKEAPGAGTRMRVTNLRVGTGDRVAAYAWQESAGRSHLCVRAQSGSTFAGRKITVDAAGAPSVTTGSDFGPCTFAVFTRDQFPRFGFYTSNPEGPTPPVSACVQFLDTVARVTVDAPEPGPVTVSEDTA